MPQPFGNTAELMAHLDKLGYECTPHPLQHGCFNILPIDFPAIFLRTGETYRLFKIAGPDNPENPETVMARELPFWKSVKEFTPLPTPKDTDDLEGDE